LSTIILWYLKKSNIRDFIVVFIVCFFFQLYTKGILRFCLQGLLGEKQRASLFQFLRLLEILFLPVFDRETEGDFINKWHQALACIERDFPSSLRTYVFHLLHHLPTYVQHYGLPSNFWMFPYERYNHTLSTAITNNQHPEISAVKKIEVIINRCLISFQVANKCRIN
jgi:hypothetical protein